MKKLHMYLIAPVRIVNTGHVDAQHAEGDAQQIKGQEVVECVL